MLFDLKVAPYNVSGAQALSAAHSVAEAKLCRDVERMAFAISYLRNPDLQATRP